MAKSSSGAGGDANDDTKHGGEESGDRIQQQIRDFAQKAADLAQNPVARTMIAAGLVTAAAAMTSNKKVRDNVKKAGRDAVDSAEEAAEAASRIGTAVVNAAADAFRRVMNLGSEEEGGEAASAKAAGGSGEARKAAKSAPAKAKSGSKAKASSGRTAKTGGAASKAKSAGGAKSKASAAGAGSSRKSSPSGGRSGRKGGGSGSSSEGSSGS